MLHLSIIIIIQEYQGYQGYKNDYGNEGEHPSVQIRGKKYIIILKNLPVTIKVNTGQSHTYCIDMYGKSIRIQRLIQWCVDCKSMRTSTQKNRTTKATGSLHKYTDSPEHLLIAHKV